MKRSITLLPTTSNGQAAFFIIATAISGLVMGFAFFVAAISAHCQGSQDIHNHSLVFLIILGSIVGSGIIDSFQSFAFTINMEEVKKLKENPANVGIKIVEIIDFEETEAEKLEIVKRHHGSKTEQRIKYDYCPELFNLLNYYCIDRTSFGKLFDAFVDVLRENS